MISITFIDHAGDSSTGEVSAVGTLMEAARQLDVAAIYAECGGAGTCGTCQVYVHPDWFDRIAPMSGDEADMLDMVLDRRPNSRLSCQLPLGEHLDGLVVETPPAQGLI